MNTLGVGPGTIFPSLSGLGWVSSLAVGNLCQWNSERVRPELIQLEDVEEEEEGEAIFNRVGFIVWTLLSMCYISRDVSRLFHSKSWSVFHALSQKAKIGDNGSEVYSIQYLKF